MSFLPDWRNAAVAHDVVLDTGFFDQFRHVKLAQNFRWPHSVRVSFADGRVVDAHEFRGGRHHNFAVYE